MIAAAAIATRLLLVPASGIVPAAQASSGEGAVATDVPPHDTLVLDSKSGAVRFLRGADLGAALPAPAAGGAEAIARAFLARYAALFRLENPAADLALRRVETEPDGAARVRFEQRRGGVPLPGTELVVHLDAVGRIVAVNGNYVPTPEAAPKQRR